MPADKQYVDAARSLKVIERLALPKGHHLTYGSLARELGYEPAKFARHVGQVCSLIDAACFWAKLPMLTLEKVRLDDGSYNPDSIGGELAPVKDTLIANASARDWTSADIAKLLSTLNSHMGDDGAVLQWKRISSFGEEGVKRNASYK